MYRTIQVTAAQVWEFSRGWPCSGLPEDVGCAVEFDPAGNLVGFSWDDGADYWEAETSGALLALIDDAKAGTLA